MEGIRGMAESRILVHLRILFVGDHVVPEMNN